MAAFAAALTAANEGASVVMLEKASAPGGTTAKSSGTMWIPNNPLMRALGIEDPKPEALRYLVKIGFPTQFDPGDDALGLPPESYRLLETFYDRGGEAYSYLDALDVLHIDETMTAAYPDYHADDPEDAAPVGRSLRVRVPEGWRYGVDATAGQSVIDRMVVRAQGLGVELRLGSRVAHVVRDDTTGRVVGVETREGRRTLLVGASKGVVFGSGGFLHDRQLRTAFLRGPVFGGAAAETSTGDFVRIGIEAGAQLGNMTHAWWDQVAVELALRVPATIRDVFSPFGDSMLMVNRHGQRVLNEKMPYSERGPVHFNWDVARREYPNLLLFMVYDDRVANDPSSSRFRYPIPMPGESGDHVMSGETLEALAASIAQHLDDLRRHTGGFTISDLFIDGLRTSIERFNGFARTGRDDDFLRGESPIERAWARDLRSDALNPTMHPLSESGPYHCVILGAGALDTKGGPVIDEASRVLAVDGEPIPGLFGAGNCIASPAGQAYWGPGGTIGLALVFGYIAGRTVVSA
jgi:hypothetical protein